METLRTQFDTSNILVTLREPSEPANNPVRSHLDTLATAGGGAHPAHHQIAYLLDAERHFAWLTP
jgi:hypothetical protein